MHRDPLIKSALKWHYGAFCSCKKTHNVALMQFNVIIHRFMFGGTYKVPMSHEISMFVYLQKLPNDAVTP